VAFSSLRLRARPTASFDAALPNCSDGSERLGFLSPRLESFLPPECGCSYPFFLCCDVEGGNLLSGLYSIAGWITFILIPQSGCCERYSLDDPKRCRPPTPRRLNLQRLISLKALPLNHPRPHNGLRSQTLSSALATRKIFPV